jgi:HK97 family phage prohead protease
MNVRAFFKTELRMEDGWIFGAVPYNSFSQTLREGGKTFKEAFLPGAFSSALRDEISLLFEHRWETLLASTAAGTLKLSETKEHLRFRAQLPESDFGRSIRDALDEGALRVSPGFNVLRQKWAARDTVRLISKAELIEISLVSSPAYKATCAAADPPQKRHAKGQDSLPRARFKSEPFLILPSDEPRFGSFPPRKEKS